MLGEIAAAIENYLPAPHRVAARVRSVATCRTGLQDAEPGSDAQLTWARHFIQAASTRRGGCPPRYAACSTAAPSPTG